MNNENWRETLSEDEFYITREKGTEAPFSGELNECKDDGNYHCKCCGAMLFSSNEKYNSGSGWPSFWDVANEKNIKTVLDESQGMRRTEVLCKPCDAHLGHLFSDGPQPTGLRYCINSLSLNFKKT